ncbi:MAG: glutamine-hydrolyzing carbamoyl-phosphate synthase small subunit [Oscillospiraceae bacterium]|nr:glutamine-hydrolyzing carbamoyl-phosphate synthase small subunit [Oscillospiraceae bacterium]
MSLFNTGDKAYVMLENGRIFEGYSFGEKGTAVGEAVFTTSMTAYQENLTDPAYYGQIITQTFPLIGNYGVNSEDYQSDKVYAKGYIVREWCNAPSNFRCEGNIDDFLKKHGVIGIHSIDTRALTKIIRENGVMNAVITTENVYDKKDELMELIRSYKIENAVKTVSSSETKRYEAENAEYEAAVLDFGCKNSLIKSLNSIGCNVTVVPADTNAEKIKELSPDGIVLSQGPGDPSENKDIINNISEISKLNIPMLGISLGHQLTALANGGKTEKLRYGHRGASQPVKDIRRNKTFVTSKNNGYTVVSGSVQNADEVFVNANDSSCEGLVYNNIPCITIQFEPDKYILGLFADMMDKKKEDK